MKKILLSIILLVFASLLAHGQQLAFPTAIGAGAYNTGGRGGQVIKVTNLNASGPGSFVEALQTTGPRIIVFEVGGTIDLRGDFGNYEGILYDTGQGVSGPNGVSGDYGNLTIAGQTAPGGITILSNYFAFYEVENIIWRYLRFTKTALGSHDTVTLNAKNQIFDHLTVVEGSDENLSVYGQKDITNITMQRCWLYNASKGGIIGGNGVTETTGKQAFTSAYNLWAGIAYRFPNYGTSGDHQHDVINNVVYGFSGRLNSMGGNGSISGSDKSDQDLNYINNYLQPSQWLIDLSGGTFPKSKTNWIQEISLDPDNVDIYAAGNILVSNVDTPRADDRDLFVNFRCSGCGGDWANYLHVDLQEFDWFANPFVQHPLVGQAFPIMTAQETYTDVVTNRNVGANAYLNDSHQKVTYETPNDSYWWNIIDNDLLARNGGHKTADEGARFEHTGFTRPVGWDTDDDGMPDSWENAEWGDLTKTATGDEDADGYTNIEEYLNLIDGAVVIVDATGVTVTPSTASINIPNTVQLSKTVDPNATDQSGVWSSSNGSVATISQSGLVTPVSVGSSTMAFTSNDGDFTDTCVVTVNNTGLRKIRKTIKKLIRL